VEEKIPVRPETASICKFFKINPLQLVSSGALLIAAKPNAANSIIEKLKQKNIHGSIIGDFLEDRQNRTIVARNGRTQALPKPASDHLWLALARS
jgi:hydrogenase maturation factor